MRSATYDLAISTVRADALFASALQRSDHPTADQAAAGGLAQAARQAADRCAGRMPVTNAGSGRVPDTPAAVARAQRIRSTAVSGCSP